MNFMERNDQASRISQYDELEKEIKILSEGSRRAEVNGVYELEICGHQMQRCYLGNEILERIRNQIVNAIENEITLLLKEQSKI